MGVAGIDDDVSLVQNAGERGQALLHRIAIRDHDHHATGRGKGPGQFSDITAR